MQTSAGMCCSVLQCVAVQFFVVCCSTKGPATQASAGTCCTMMQCVAMQYMLQCVAVQRDLHLLEISPCTFHCVTHADAEKEITPFDKLQ